LPAKASVAGSNAGQADRRGHEVSLHPALLPSLAAITLQDIGQQRKRAAVRAAPSTRAGASVIAWFRAGSSAQHIAWVLSLE